MGLFCRQLFDENTLHIAIITKNTRFCYNTTISFFRQRSSVVEQCLHKAVVTGPNPVAGTLLLRSSVFHLALIVF